MNKSNNESTKEKYYNHKRTIRGSKYLRTEKKIAAAKYRVRCWNDNKIIDIFCLYIKK